MNAKKIPGVHRHVMQARVGTDPWSPERHSDVELTRVGYQVWSVVVIEDGLVLASGLYVHRKPATMSHAAIEPGCSVNWQVLAELAHDYVARAFKGGAL